MEVSLPFERIAKLASASIAEPIEVIQSLWSGYGQIVRVRLLEDDSSAAAQAKSTTAIVKHVDPPESRDHKYGWSGDVSHQRKLRSYDNETHWYRNASQHCDNASQCCDNASQCCDNASQCCDNASPHCDSTCRVPQLIGAEASGNDQSPSWLLVLEDLDAAGFHLRHRSVSDAQLNACLDWLAHFHATFMFDATDVDTKSPSERHQLWPIGTYWHLETRPDELTAMEPGPLKQAAAKIDATLNQARFQTLVHGDAKLANFCFAADDRVAAVDFQYVGGGCGMKDLAYFISSCFSDDECERREQELLDNYFGRLEIALAIATAKRSDVKSVSFAAIEAEWRALYPVAWADFYRFLAGWSPGHWKMHGYSKRVTEAVLAGLGDLQ